MAELDKDVATFLEQGKLNAANRLENQLAILKVQESLSDYCYHGQTAHKTVWGIFPLCPADIVR